MKYIDCRSITRGATEALEISNKILQEDLIEEGIYNVKIIMLLNDKINILAEKLWYEFKFVEEVPKIPGHTMLVKKVAEKKKVAKKKK